MYKNQKIIKVKKNDEGNITDIMLEDGKVLPLNQAIMMTKHGEVDGVNVGRGKNGGEFLKADPNEFSSDNLSKLPTFK